MTISTHPSLAMAGALFIFDIWMLSSVLQLHILVLAFLDIVEPITLSFCVTIGLCVIAWYWVQMPSHHVKFRSDTRSQGTQTLDEPPTLSMVWASRGGNVFISQIVVLLTVPTKKSLLSGGVATVGRHLGDDPSHWGTF